MKLLSLSLFAILFSTFAFAGNSPIEKLPFDIVIGKTKNSEIADKGVCIKEIQISSSYFRCELYKMLGGKFYVYSSQNEIVTKVEFDGFINHALPKSWQNLGLKLGDFQPYSINIGTLENDFLSIIIDNGAENISTSESVSNNFKETIISFDIGINHFDATFKEWLRTSQKYGLIKITVTEQY